MADLRPQITLGQFIEKLRKLDPERQIQFDFGGLEPTGFRSYRGYYDHLALGFGPGNFRLKVHELLAAAEKALHNSFEGYKGGTYFMKKDTPLWAANWGETGDTGIVDVVDHDWVVVIETRFIP